MPGKQWWERISRIDAAYGVIMAVLTFGGAILGWAEGIPWTYRIPAILLTICLGLWIFERYGKPYFAQHASSKVTPTPAQKKHVDFLVLGIGRAAPFQTEITATSDVQTWEHEKLVLRIRAAANLKNTSLRFEIERVGPGKTVLVTGHSKAFMGNVPNATHEDIELLTREYVAKFAPKDFDEEAGGTRQRIKLDRRVTFLPDADKSCEGKTGEIYRFKITVLHDDGPDACQLMVDISKLDRPKTRLMEALGNVEITNEYRAIPGVYYFD